MPGIARPTLLAASLLAACATPEAPAPAAVALAAAEAAPAPAQPQAWRPPPAVVPEETYSVDVSEVAVNELLYALAREARINIDIHPGIAGRVSLNAVAQTLPQLLTRIARQVELRFEFVGGDLVIQPDAPFLKHYRVDYLNMSRQVSGVLASSSQIATGVSGANAGAAVPVGGNLSNTRIENNSHNQFWESLERNIRDLLRDSDKALPDGSSETVLEENRSLAATGPAALPPASGGAKAAQALAGLLQAQPNPASSSRQSGSSTIRRSTFREAATVIVNAESGLVSVRATQRQHERIGEFIAHVAAAVRRQVVIEATILEIQLKDGYQQGINWSQLVGNGAFDYLGNALSGNAVNLRYRRSANPDALITLLASYGQARVLSNPRLAVLNNQTALLKVVENYVYFSVKADTVSTASVGSTTTYTTTPQSVSVGLVVSVTPQVSDNDEIILNVRPTVTSIAREIADPNPELIKNGINNYVPVIRTREIESVLRIASGSTAVLGGLIEERSDLRRQQLPLIGQVPLVGEVFTNRNEASEKNELVILLRPIVLRDAPGGLAAAPPLERPE